MPAPSSTFGHGPVERCLELADKLQTSRAGAHMRSMDLPVDDMADLIRLLARHVKGLAQELAVAESMYKVTLQQRNQAWAQLATGDKGQTLLPAGSITRHTDGSTRLWGLGVSPYLDTATSCEPIYTLTQAASAAPEPSGSPG